VAAELKKHGFEHAADGNATRCIRPAPDALHGACGFYLWLLLIWRKLPVCCVFPCNCCQPDEAGAILNYYFGAANGDMFASAALGYRHAFGLGVPKSCWSAVAYYKWVCLLSICVGDAVHGRPDGLRPVMLGATIPDPGAVHRASNCKKAQRPGSSSHTKSHRQ
jgi:hypothetical protein